MKNNVKEIKIGDGRYLLLIQYGRERESYIMQSVDRVTEQLKEWWEGEEKFFPLVFGDDIEVTVERLEEE